MITNYLNDSTILLEVEEKNWVNAIKICGNVLLSQDKIDEKYIDAMIKNVYDLGDYIVIAPGIAMPHARPECGAKDIGLVMLKLKNKIPFGKNGDHEVDLLFALCSPDNKSHIGLLSDLVALIEDEDFISSVRDGMKKEKIIAYLRDNYKED